MLHVWYIYLQKLGDFVRANGGKYSSTMEHMGYKSEHISPHLYGLYPNLGFFFIVWSPSTSPPAILIQSHVTSLPGSSLSTMRLHHIFGFLALSLKGVLGKMHKARLILDGYFNPLVFWYQWEYLRSPANNLSFFAGYLADWQGKFFRKRWHQFSRGV